MTQDYSVRALTPNDWQEFAAIRLEALQKYPQFFGSTYAVESTYDQEKWQGWLSRKDGCVFGLYHQEKIIGITGIRPLSKEPMEEAGLLIASYIKPDYQKKGLSEKLYEARIRWALAYPQWKKLIVSHREGNDSSRRANQKWGFRFINTSPRTWYDGTIANDYNYELDLEELRAKKKSLTN